MGQATRISAEELEQMLVHAVKQHQAGQVEAAATLYHQILDREPQHPDALHLVGLAMSQLGDPTAARHHVERAIAVRADCADYHNSLGVVLSSLHECEKAEESYRQALRLRPDYVEAQFNLAGLLHRDGHADEAALLYSQAVLLRPDDASIHNNLGCAMRDLGERGEARRCYEKALQLDPQFDNAKRNLAAMDEEDAIDDGPQKMACTPPVIVVGPTAHDGAIAIQRLLNATGKMVIFGEDPLFFSSIPRMFFEKLAMHECLGEEGAAARRRITEDPTVLASGPLWPDPELYARTVGACFNRIVDMYRTSARELGGTHWGILASGREDSAVGRLRQLLPTTRIIFVYRNVFDVARAAKASQTHCGPADMTALAGDWQRQVLSNLNEDREDTLALRFEDIVSGQHINDLEAFVDVSGLNPGLLDTHREPPAVLTPEESSALRAAAAEALALTQYTDHATCK